MPLESAAAARAPTKAGELLLERVDVRAERRDPVGVERLEQQRPLTRTDVGRRQEEPGHGQERSGGVLGERDAGAE